jgi:hypothetical protein
MARQITETYFGYDQPDVWIEVDGTEYRGEMRAKATDGDLDTNRGCVWWAHCLVRYAPGDNRLEWHPADRVRLDVDQFDSLDFVRSRTVGIADVIALRRREGEERSVSERESFET